eukprot:2265065-Prymnesium_polylepis.1
MSLASSAAAAASGGPGEEAKASPLLRGLVGGAAYAGVHFNLLLQPHRSQRDTTLGLGRSITATTGEKCSRK